MRLVVLIVLLAPQMPDPGQPAFPNICGTFGGFVGMAVGMSWRSAWERTMKLAAQAGAVGYGIGFAIWLVIVTTDRL